MPVPRPSLNDITNRIYNKITLNTPLSADLNSSIIGMIIQIIASELDDVWAYIDQEAANANLNTAVGTALDNYGLLLGVPRKTAKAATSLGSTPSLRITNLGSSTLVVPVGSRFFSSADPTIAFYSNTVASIAAGSYTDVNITAAGIGTQYNVGIGQIDSSNIPSAAVSVTNILPIQNGSGDESDGSYRQRILQSITQRQGLNLANLDALIRGVPGVQDDFILNMKRGSGTLDVVVIPTNYSATNQIVAACQNVLDTYLPAGISAIAYGPKYRQLDVSINLVFTPNAGTQMDIARNSIKAQITSRIQNLPVEDGSGNGTFNTAQISSIANLSNPAVLSSTVQLGLDGYPISPSGTITLGIGERLLLRSLTVQ